jgi:Nif-specific regulatory protein
VGDPGDPEKLEKQLARIAFDEDTTVKYIFDSLTGMVDLWGNEDLVLKFFGHICPRLYDLNSIAYWLLEKDAHSERFLAKLRHVTQVVLELAMSQGVGSLTIRKAANRRGTDIGVPQQFDVENGRLTITVEPRVDRELGLLTRMGEAAATAVDIQSFFEQAVQVLARELGMLRGTIVLLDRVTNKLRIAASHGLSPEEKARGEYAIGEGVTGRVAQTGQPEIVPDISQDARFLDRTAARKADRGHLIAFLCAPLKVGDKVIGALSVDRLHAGEASLDKDLRLLTIVASTVSQALKINRLISVEKEKVLARDEGLLREFQKQYDLGNIVGQSEAIQEVLVTAATAAKSRASILISGPTGTGKELVAHVIHYNSPRATGPFVKVSCGALPDTLLESELFGHVKGAFTGAVETRKGRFELAHGGTLFLDEVGEMSPRLQVKLLRVLQEREFEPVGAAQTIRVDVRLVAATNKDLRRQVREGGFREDLYYRLNVIPIHLPPLRNRRQDVPLLVNHFLEKYNRENAKNVSKISPETLDRLLAYPWPGNVRELENCIERAVVMSPDETLAAALLPEEILTGAENVPDDPLPSPAGEHDAEVRSVTARAYETAEDLAALREALVRAVDETIIRKALSERLPHRELANRLGISRTTLSKKIRQYGIE